MALILVISSLSACSWLARKVPIEQGNIFNQAMVSQLKPGMSVDQVEHIMGAPVLSNDFDPNRLDYVYTYQKGKKDHQYQRVTLFFVDGKLAKVQGTMIPEEYVALPL